MHTISIHFIDNFNNSYVDKRSAKGAVMCYCTAEGVAATLQHPQSAVWTIYSYWPRYESLMVPIALCT